MSDRVPSAWQNGCIAIDAAGFGLPITLADAYATASTFEPYWVPRLPA